MLSFLIGAFIGFVVGFVLACILTANACNSCPLIENYEPELPVAEDETRL